MSEWSQFLLQTHPQFKDAMTVEEALEQEEAESLEIEAKEVLKAESLKASNALEQLNVTSSNLNLKNEKEELVEVQVTENQVPNDSTISEIEWISPTHKLQDKIENIPDKMGFKIGEAADYVGVKQYVLRYWESEFELFNPKKSKNGQRKYTKRDVETALLIRKLLHEDRFSIEGAQAALKKLRKQVKDKPSVEEVVIQASSVEKKVSPQISLEFAQSLLEMIQQTRAILKL